MLQMSQDFFVNFNSFAFHPQIQAGIHALNFSTPTPIQARAIPPLLEGQDVLGLAQTGTGKTAAFVLPILERLMRGRRGVVRALILSPTRELADQTHTVIQSLGRQTGLRSLAIYGGVSSVPQVKGLRAGAEIVVACPGRLLDLLGQERINLKSVEALVIDEADRLFDMGFLPDVRRIVAALPATRQSMLFSATMPAELTALVSEFLRHAVTIEVDASRPVEAISHTLYPVEQGAKAEFLQALLKQTGNYQFGRSDEGQALVFTRTKHRARKVAHQLNKAGFSAASLQGDLSQVQRQKAMDGFRSGRVKILVATDIAARGIDVSQISQVINYDMPDTADAYTHRIGRTGRMSRRGAALSLVTQEDLPMVRRIERNLGKTMEKRRLQSDGD